MWTFVKATQVRIVSNYFKPDFGFKSLFLWCFSHIIWGNIMKNCPAGPIECEKKCRFLDQRM